MTCERCWWLAGGDPDEYRRLLDENDCTPEQQAGFDAQECPECGRKTVHQHVGRCVVCNYPGEQVA